MVLERFWFSGDGAMYDENYEERQWPRRVLKIGIWLAIFAAVGWWYAHHEWPITARQRVAIVRDTTKSIGARRIAADQLQTADASVVPGLIEELQTGDTLGREVAALALGRLGPKAAAAVEPLVQAAEHSEARVRKQAVIALGRIDAQPQVFLAVLRNAAHDTDHSIRNEAFAVLGRWYADGGEALVSLLADDDDDVRRRAGIQLGQMGFDTDDANQALHRVLADSDPHVRAEAYAALFHLSAIEAHELATGMTEDPDPLVRRTALRLLSKHPGKKAEMFFPAVNDANSDVQLAALGQFLDMGETERALPVVASLFDSGNQETIWRAARLLVRVGPPARHIAERLLAHLDDPDDNVGESVWVALNETGLASKLRPPELFDALHADGDTALSFIHFGPNSIAATPSREPPKEDPREYALTDADMEHVKRLRLLQYLYLARNPIGDAGLAQLAELSELKWLNLYDTKVTSAGLRHLAAFSNLRELDLGRCAVTDEGLKHLDSLRELQALDLSGTRVTDAGMAHLTKLPRLRSLQLGRTDVTDEGLVHLKQLTSLQEISVPEQVTLRSVARLGRLTKIEGVPKSVTDADLESLPALTQLRDLDLRGTSVTDTGLVHLKTLKNLRRLSLVGTKVTPRGVDDLKAALPDLIIYGFTAAAPRRPTPEYKVVGLKSLETGR